MTAGVKPKIDIDKELRLSINEYALYQKYNPLIRVSSPSVEGFFKNQLEELSELIVPSEQVRVVMSLTRYDLQLSQQIMAADFARAGGVSAAEIGSHITSSLLENENRSYKLSLRLWVSSGDHTGHDLSSDGKLIAYDPTLWWRGADYDKMLANYEILADQYSTAAPLIGSISEFLSGVMRDRLSGVAEDEMLLSRGWGIISDSRIWVGSARRPIGVSSAMGKIRIKTRFDDGKAGDGMPISFGTI
jgi:hypothetical protein